MFPIISRNLFIVLMLGFFALLAGCFIFLAHPYDFLFKWKVTLAEGGEIFENWRKPEVNLYTRIYLFNVTNAQDFLDGKDHKLNIQEVGPYVYKEALEHTNVTFNENGTLSSVPIHPLTWVPELSEGRTEEDILFLPHIALLSIAHVIGIQGWWAYPTKLALNTLISSTNSQPLVQMTAKEFMFGFESSILTLGNKFMPGWISFPKLGLIDRMYDFEGDYETIYTGETDVALAGLIDTYRGSDQLPQWKDSCSNIKYASDGTKFRGNQKQNDTVLFFRKSLCRAAPMIQTGEGVRSGLPAYKYTLPEDFLDNGKTNEDNKCFCRKDNCLPVGLLDVTDCYYGFPIALSFPHFYMGDDVLHSKIEGLNPSKEEHETRFWIEPTAGLPVDVSAKFQINMALGDTSSITNADKFADIVLPLLWFDIRMYSLPQAMEDRFKLYLIVLPIVEQTAMYLLFVSGSLMIVIAVYMLTFKVLFKSVDRKKSNIIIGTGSWVDNEKRRQDRSKSNVYAACEIPLGSDSESDQNIKDLNLERRPSGFMKSHGDRIKELGSKLSDKVYDSVGSVKDRIRDEIVHVKHIFDAERRGSLIPPNSSTYNNIINDSSDETDGKQHGLVNYHMVNTSDSDDDCKYLEVLDVGTEFDHVNLNRDRRMSKDVEVNIQRMNNLDNVDSNIRIEDEDLILNLKDLPALSLDDV